MRRLKDVHAAGRPADGKLIHILSSGIKAAATWTKVDVLQQCREACGGMGFLAANKIGPMITDTNVDVTFEGARAARGWGGGKGAARGAPSTQLHPRLGAGTARRAGRGAARPAPSNDSPPPNPRPRPPPRPPPPPPQATTRC